MNESFVTRTFLREANTRKAGAAIIVANQQMTVDIGDVHKVVTTHDLTPLETNVLAVPNKQFGKFAEEVKKAMSRPFEEYEFMASWEIQLQGGMEAD